MKAVSLGEVALINPREGKLPIDLRVSFVGMAQLDAEGGLAKPQTMRTYGEVANGYTVFRDGDILAAKITPCWENGKVGQADLDSPFGIGSTEFHVIRPMAGLDARYLLHFLRQSSIRNSGEARMTGSAGQKRVPVAFLRDLIVPLPGMSEQRRIAAILDQADALRGKRRQIQDDLDALAQSIFHEMFNGTATWPDAPIGDLGCVVTGKTPPTAKEDMFGGSIPFVTPGDLGSGNPVARWLSVEGSLNSRVVRRGATLVCCIGATIGKMDMARVPSAFNQQINAVEWNSKVDDTYGLAALKQIKKQIVGNAAMTTLPLLTKGQFVKLRIPVPEFALQRDFAARLAHVSKHQRVTSRSLEVQDELFASLQSRAFTGEL
jgi:type I restriction enzyme, S subunit